MIDYLIRSRYDNLRLELGDSGNLYFQDKRYIMEVKTLDSFPMWFTKILEGCHIYPDSFSKYGNIYSKKIKGEIYV